MAQHRVLDLVGLTWDDARNVCEERGVNDDEIEIVETSPPLRPPRRENAQQKRKTKAPTKAPKPAPRFGQLRVLRVVELDGRMQVRMQVTVAREELKPDESEIAAPLESQSESPMKS